ncbi:MAG: NrpR regulatory domain-containing protein [Methanoculleus chikugoensis]|nr:NrpR regulatory domain-containing protein [Methanoculleus chikugoensis]
MTPSIRSERKYLEILRILAESHEPLGAKRLSEKMAERGFVLSDRAVQYYLQYLDEMGFTEKAGNRGRLLTEAGIAESESALVDQRLGFIISRLEQLAFRSTFDPLTATGSVAYNLSFVREEDLQAVTAAFDQVAAAGYGFLSAYRIVDSDPRIPDGHTGIMTVCSVTLDGVLQKMGIPTRLEYAGRIAVDEDGSAGFLDLIGYRGTSVDPLHLFISARLTSINRLVTTRAGVALANVRAVPAAARHRVETTVGLMEECGFTFPAGGGIGVFNLPKHPYRLPVVAFSGMNMVGNAVEKGYAIKTEIGAGTIPFGKIADATAR